MLIMLENNVSFYFHYPLMMLLYLYIYNWFLKRATMNLFNRIFSVRLKTNCQTTTRTSLPTPRLPQQW